MHVLAKPTGAVCNLDCSYCFYLSKEKLYPGSRFRMEDAVLEAYVRQAPGALTWQGGEPTLMGLDFYRRAVALAPPGTRHEIQTNGVLLDDEWCAFLAEHKFLVGLSLDGPREVHDAYRVDKGGKPTFARVMAGLERLRAHGVEYNLLCTVHAANCSSPVEVYRFLRSCGDFLQFLPVVERVGQGVSDRSVPSLAWGDFLIGVFDEWVRHDVGRIYVQSFEAALAAWMGLPTGLCLFEETCGQALALEHNGDVYSCDHFVEPRFLLGNLKEAPLEDLARANVAFGNAKRDTLPAYCRACEVRFACHGECPKNRFLTTPDGEPGLNYLCAGYRKFFNHVDGPMKRMAELLRARRPPAWIMREPGARES